MLNDITDAAHSARNSRLCSRHGFCKPKTKTLGKRWQHENVQRGEQVPNVGLVSAEDHAVFDSEPLSFALEAAHEGTVSDNHNPQLWNPMLEPFNRLEQCCMPFFRLQAAHGPYDEALMGNRILSSDGT